MLKIKFRYLVCHKSGCGVKVGVLTVHWKRQKPSTSATIRKQRRRNWTWRDGLYQANTSRKVGSNWMKKSQVCFLSQKVKVKGLARTVTPIVMFNFFQTFCINVSARVCAYYIYVQSSCFLVLGMCMTIMFKYFISNFCKICFLQLWLIFYNITQP